MDDAERLATNQRVLDAWLPSFLSGKRAADELYAFPVTTWHNVGEFEAEIGEVPSGARLRQVLPDLHHVDVRTRVDAEGFTLQATVVADGGRIRVPTCLVATVVDGHIQRFEEYVDSAAATPLIEALGGI